MATLQRLTGPSRHILRNYARKRAPVLTCRFVSTSDKDIKTSPDESNVDKSQELKDLEKHFGDTDPTKLKNWQSYGFDYYDRENDTFQMNLVNFSLFTLGICLGGFIIAYMPDVSMREWAYREAYLEIERRQRAGLPLIDPYLIPPDQVDLPSEEEIGDQEIII